MRAERNRGQSRAVRLSFLGVAALVAACGHTPGTDGPPTRSEPISRSGDPIPGPEPRSRYGNPPYYEALGRRYSVMDSADGYVERGVASWYGRKFHGRRTSSGEIYDMHKMTAAHKSLPLPTWVEVTNLRTRKSIIVRVNDRGPFVENRIIDLSYEAAQRLDIITDGTGLVEVRALDFSKPFASRAPTVVAARQQPEAAAPQDPAPASAAPVERPATGVSQTPPMNAAEPLERDGESGTVDATASAREPSTPRIFAQVGAFTEAGNAKGLRLRLHQTGFSSASIHETRGESPQYFRVRIGPVHEVAEYDALVARLRDYGVSTVTMIIE